MSLLVAGTVVAGVGKAALTAYLAPKGKEMYLLGSDVLGAELPVKAVEPVPVREVRSGYWTSVGAGMTVAGIVVLAGYAYAKSNGRKHDLDLLMRKIF